MSTGVIATRYASGLAQAAANATELDAWLGEVQRFAKAWRGSGLLRAVATNPGLSQARREAVLEPVFAELGLSATPKRWLKLIWSRDRLGIVPDAVDALGRLVDTRRGVLRAKAEFAVAPSPAQLKSLTERLEKLTGKQVVLEDSEDASLLAGFRVRIGSHLVDASLKQALSKMQRDLLAGLQH